jgi:hypothetical protein
MTGQPVFVAFRSCVILLMLGGVAQAQVTFEPRALRARPLAVKFDPECSKTGPSEAELAQLKADPVGRLNRLFQEGDWNTVQLAAAYLLDQAKCAASSAIPKVEDLAAYDHRSNYVWLTWIGTDAFDTYGLHRLLVHALAATPYRINLPGESRIYEVFASSAEKAELTTVLTSTEQPNPTAAQIPAVFEKVVPVLFGLLSSTKGVVSAPEEPVPPAPASPPPPPVKLWVKPYEITLPAKRATIAVHSLAAEPVPADEFNDDADKLAIKLGFQLSQCARTLAIEQVKKIQTTRATACVKDATSCLDDFDKVLRETFEAQKTTPECAPETDQKAMVVVDTAVRAFVVSNMGREVQSDVSLANTPLQRFSFGIVEAVAFGAKLYDPRVKLADDGALKADPMPRLMTIVTVNRSFSGYDASTLSPSAEEKQRWFFGAVIAPDFGLALGYSYLPIRGLSINAGVAGVFVKSVDQEAIGKAPAVATDPFKIGRAAAVFLGVGYAFK